MAIFPGNWHPDYEKNVQKLQSEGYRYAKQEELPESLQQMCGAETFLIGKTGTLKSVSQSTGEVNDVKPEPVSPLDRNCWITPAERQRRADQKKRGPK
jgi:hypothetical protein